MERKFIYTDLAKLWGYDKMNIAILSLGSGGTMGHMSLTTKLSSLMIKKNNVYLFSDHDYSNFSNIKNPKFKTIKIPSHKHQQTVGGELTYKSKETIFLELKKSTFLI